MARRLYDVMIAATLAGAVIAVTPIKAQTQTNLSEKLSNTMMGAKREHSALDDSTKEYDRTLAREAEAPQKRRIALKGRAAVFEMAKEFDRAEADLTAAINMEPADASDLADRGYFYLRLGRYKEAMHDFLAGVQQDPRNARYRYGAGRVHANMQNYPAAIDFYSQAVRLNPKDGVVHLSRAEAYLHLKRLTEAKADYDRAIQLGLKRPSDRYFGYFGRGYVSLLQENFAGAVADFDAALETEPLSLDAWLCRGIANERRGRSDLAIDDFERAYMIDPGNGLVMAGLRRLRSREPLTSMPAFEFDEKRRLAQELLPGVLPRRRPQM